MKFSLALFLASMASTSSRDLQSCGKTLAFDESPCTAGLLNNTEINGCSAFKIIAEIKKVYNTIENCEWDFGYELRLITRTLSQAKVNLVLEELCAEAANELWQAAPVSSWTDIDPKFTPDFMDDYTDGGTFLNFGQGNFRNRDGSDPTQNLFSPTDQESYEAGLSINEFYEDGATSSILQELGHLDSCQNQAMMCCFGRDRQYQDGNGNCAKRACDDADPGDNSNLCFVGTDGDAEPHPGDETIHCHGLAWAADMEDPSYRLRFNNFFYVLMHDHMYSRGYVEAAIDGVPMCGCVEDMPKVVRADCSEVLMQNSFFVSIPDGEDLLVEPGPLDFKFRACRGVTYDEATGEQLKENNDLASHINMLVLDEKMDEATRDIVFETLVGHDSPSDNVNEQACEEAWADMTQGAAYVAP